MIQSDALSQQPDLFPKEDHDNEDQILLPDDLFVRLVNTELSRKFDGSSLTNPFFATLEAAIQSKTLPPIHSSLSDWVLRNGMIFYKQCCYVPANKDL